MLKNKLKVVQVHIDYERALQIIKHTFSFPLSQSLVPLGICELIIALRVWSSNDTKQMQFMETQFSKPTLWFFRVPGSVLGTYCPYILGTLDLVKFVEQVRIKEHFYIGCLSNFSTCKCYLEENGSQVVCWIFSWVYKKYVVFIYKTKPEGDWNTVRCLPISWLTSMKWLRFVGKYIKLWKWF